MMTYIRSIGPAEADELLERNFEGNRKMNDQYVYDYARAMVEGRFESLNGQTIVLGTDGKLYDGQTRMAAVSLAGVTLPFMFVVDEDAEKHFATVDQGRVRSLAQFGKLPYKTVCDKIAKFGFCIEKGASTEEALGGKLPKKAMRLRNSGGKYPNPKPGLMEVYEWEMAHADSLVIAARFGTSIYDSIGMKLGRGMGASTFGIAAYMLMRFGDSSMLEAFRRDAISDTPSDKSAGGLTKSIRNASRDGKLTRESAIGFVIADYTYFLKGDGKKANMPTAISSYEVMARKIDSRAEGR